MKEILSPTTQHWILLSAISYFIFNCVRIVMVFVGFWYNNIYLRKKARTNPIIHYSLDPNDNPIME